MATDGTANVLENAGIRVEIVDKIGSEGPTLLDVIRNGEAQFVINTLTIGKQPERDGFRIRRERSKMEFHVSLHLIRLKHCFASLNP